MNFAKIKLCLLYGDGCVTGGRPGLQTRACGTNTVVDRFDSYTSPPYFNNVRVHRRDHFKKRPVLSATIHPKIKRTLVEISERTGMSISQVTDEVLYTGLVEMQEL